MTLNNNPLDESSAKHLKEDDKSPKAWINPSQKNHCLMKSYNH